MAHIIFRESPGVPASRWQLDMHFRDRLHEDELEELPQPSSARFLSEPVGITSRGDTFYSGAAPIRFAGDMAGPLEEQVRRSRRYSPNANARWRRLRPRPVLREKGTACTASMSSRQLVSRFAASIPPPSSRVRRRQDARARLRGDKSPSFALIYPRVHRSPPQPDQRLVQRLQEPRPVGLGERRRAAG